MSLNRLYSFLSHPDNRKYNHALQEKFFKSVIVKDDTEFNNFTRLLYFTINTQSQPRIDFVGKFFKNYYAIFDGREFSFQIFYKSISSSSQFSFETFFRSLSKQPGWGDKTSALLTKNLFLMHKGKHENYKFVNDLQSQAIKVDKIFIPVDRVIEDFFKPLIPTSNFIKINTLLQKNYSPHDMIIWDDLWFWGFFGSRTLEGNRVFGDFNENKYWALQESSKNPKDIEEVKEKMNEFFSIYDKLKSDSL